MIDTAQDIIIDAPIGQVWDVASDITAWANLMPGLQDCVILDQDRSSWILKVGAGGLVRSVKVNVHVARWAGPEEVDFTYSLDGDPVQGGGTYRARALGPQKTEIGLAVRVEGSGPMAPMWEALGRPLLPKLARGFAEQFKAEIEQRTGVAQAEPVTGTAGWLRRSIARCLAWLRGLTGRSGGQAHCKEVER
jgi:carbon monoxide dehydrogenase subunit G